MRTLFEMDKKDYSRCNYTYTRNSARSIIIRDGRVAMVHSLKYDYYKFPGGGIEEGENPIDAMIRETREEAGLRVVPESVKEYGIVHRIQKSDKDETECFVQDNYYYLCEAADDPIDQDLDEYEAKECYKLEFADPAAAIRKNRSVQESPYNRMGFEREARVLELLQAEGYLKTEEGENEKYVCKIASPEEMNQKWDYEIRLHPGTENWIVWKGEAIEGFLSGRSVPYYGILDGTVICEATAVLCPDIPQVDRTTESHVIELCAFRTIKEYRGKGYFSKLMDFMLKDLKQKGYTKAVVGVEPEEKLNREIYRHWGFTERISTGTETYPDGTVINAEFYGRQL